MTCILFDEYELEYEVEHLKAMMTDYFNFRSDKNSNFRTTIDMEEFYKKGNLNIDEQMELEKFQQTANYKVDYWRMMKLKTIQYFTKIWTDEYNKDQKKQSMVIPSTDEYINISDTPSIALNDLVGTRDVDHISIYFK